MDPQGLTDNIIALSTPPGVSAIAVVRLSGATCIALVNEAFKGTDLTTANGNTIHFGTIRDGEAILDEVLVSVFKGPKSFTKEDSIEISCHGSPFVVKSIIELLIKQGARYAKAGEFTTRAYLNGQFDLAQAEAVADLIHSDSEASHKAAMNQLRGGFSNEIKGLREQLIHFASMVELELDFGEEDVEFADRGQLRNLVLELQKVIQALIDSFKLGNAIKDGVPVVIAGKPNAGKSTLLNSLLQEEKAIVTPIAGTTRDFIEDEIIIDGIKFRFIDTAGLRETVDEIEAIGVARSKEQLEKASLILYLFDSVDTDSASVNEELIPIKELGIPYILIGNKIDEGAKLAGVDEDILYLSAQSKEAIESLKSQLISTVGLDSFSTGDTIVTNARHFESLTRTQEALDKTIVGLDTQVTADFVAMDIRQGLRFLSEITGDITTEDLLENIFSKFCIGK